MSSIPTDQAKESDPPHSSVEDADALIAEQLKSMSSVDREKALFDLHGVVTDSLVKETPD